MSRTRNLLPRILAAALCLVALPAAAGPQGPAQPPVAQAPEGALELQQEMVQLQQELAPIQASAMADPDLQQAQARLTASIEAELSKAEPAFAKKVKRLEALAQELVQMQQAAQAGQPFDEARVQVLVTEGAKLEAELVRLQVQVMQREPLASQLKAFEDQVRAKMVAVDPKAKALLAQADGLIRRMEAMEDTAALEP